MRTIVRCLAVVLLVAPSVRADGVFSLGQCPVVTTPIEQAGVSIAAINYGIASPGKTWYQYSRYSSFLGPGKTCSYLTVVAPAATFPMTFTYRAYAKLFDSYETYSGTITYKAASPWDQLTITTTTSSGNIVRNVQILNPDNPDYVVLWSCENLAFGNIQRAWVFTASRVPSPTVVNSINNAVRSAGLSTNKLKPSSQNNCPA